MRGKIEAVLKAKKLLKTISNENRLLILCHIKDKEFTVNELVDIIGLSQSALSQHLALMRNQGFVKTRREHQNIYYSIKSTELKEIITILYKKYCCSHCK